MKSKRKSRILILAFSVTLASLVITSSAAATEPTCVPPPSGMVGWWPGDGNPNDIIGGNPGTLVNGATFAPGKVAQAFRFDGVDDLVRATTTGLPTGNADRTLALWVKIDAFLPGEAFFAGYGSFGLNDKTYHLGTSGNILFFSQWGAAVFGPTLQTGRWYHIAVTNAGNSVTLYLDGAVASSASQPINTPAGTKFYIGKIPEPEGATRKLQGTIDEVEIFNRALAPSEIAAIYNADTAGNCKSPPTGGNGSFVIGDLDAVVGRKVYFWGSQWAKKNTLSQGNAPSAFKGFANSIGGTTPNCGGTWTSDPGNSSGPPSSVPALITVIASSSATKSRSLITGNDKKIVVVKTDPGYAPDPGHPGTGTVMSVTCQ